MADHRTTPSRTGAHAPPHDSVRQSVILVTGAGGEVGHGLISSLNDAGCDNIIAVDIHPIEIEQASMCRECHVGDICDTTMLQRLLARCEITEIHHLAALLSSQSEFTPELAHEVNVNGTLNLFRLAAEQARSHGRCVKFLYPSSIAAYGLPSLAAKQAAGRVSEDQWARPITMYGCNKLYCEQIGRYYARHYRQLARDRIEGLIDFRCLRYPGLISSETTPEGGTSDFVPEMLHAAAHGRPYTCFVRSDTRIPFMTMPEAIASLLTLASADASSLTRCVYNVASFSPTAGEFAAAVLAFFPGTEITFTEDPGRQVVVDSWPEDVDTGAAERDWGFQPIHDLRSALQDYCVPRIRRGMSEGGGAPAP